jgi:hypothetical protein
VRTIFCPYLQATRQAIKRGIRLMIFLFVLLLVSASSISGKFLLGQAGDPVSIFTLMRLKEKVNLSKFQFQPKKVGKVQGKAAASLLFLCFRPSSSFMTLTAFMVRRSFHAGRVTYHSHIHLSRLTV